MMANVCLFGAAQDIWDSSLPFSFICLLDFLKDKLSRTCIRDVQRYTVHTWTLEIIQDD